MDASEQHFHSSFIDGNEESMSTTSMAMLHAVGPTATQTRAISHHPWAADAGTDVLSVLSSCRFNCFKTAENTH